MLAAFWHMPTHPPPLICPTLAHPHKPDLGSARPLLPPHLIFSILSPLKACKSSVGAPSKVGESSCTCVSTNSRFISPPIRHPRPLVWLCCLLNVCALSATPALSYAIVCCVLHVYMRVVGETPAERYTVVLGCMCMRVVGATYDCFV